MVNYQDLNRTKKKKNRCNDGLCKNENFKNKKIIKKSKAEEKKKKQLKFIIFFLE